MKGALLILIFTLFLTSFVVAQVDFIELSTIPEDKIFSVGQTIRVMVTLRDTNNNPITGDVEIKLNDLKEELILEKTISSGNFEEIELPEAILSGEGEMIITYEDLETTESFFITEKKLIEFAIEGETLIVTNTGNTRYEETIYITIGDTTGSKNPKLNVGQSIKYRLVAPEGVYNLKITDGSTTLERSEIRLTGTGNVVGAIDESAQQGTGITGISPNADSEGELIGMLSRSKFTYTFILVIFGAMVLLAIERRFKKKIPQ